MDYIDAASAMAGRSRLEGSGARHVTNAHAVTGTAMADSSDGTVLVDLGGDVTTGDGSQWVEVQTDAHVLEGDQVDVLLVGEAGRGMSPVIYGVPGGGDRMAAAVLEAAGEVEQVRQDVADFRDDVATTYATKVERQDGDDAVKTWVTTNYTNSNDLATTYATKTLVSQTKDAIELAASQTYETQSDAAATYATKSALTVGLDGIRTEVAEDYQPKGDYATTASMNSAIQQSASSIESSVAATYETKSDASATYATKTDVTQTVSGLDTRITTATNTANSAKSAVDNLQVGGTNLAIGSKDFAFASQAAKTNRYVGVQYSTQAFRTRSDGFVETVARSNWNGISVYANALNLAVGDTVTLSVDVRSDATVGNTLAFYAMAYNSSGTRLFGSILGLESRNGSNAGAGDISIYPSTTFSPGAHDRVWVKITWLQRAQDIVDAGGRIALTIQATAATSSNTNVSFWAVKLEHGNTPTSWSPAPEDMATEADLQAEVTERQTLIRQFSGGVLAGYVGNAIAALVNAAGSFDVVRTAWTDGVPSILGTLARYAASGISLFDAAGNVLAEFASDHVRIGGDVPIGDATTGGEASVQFFDQTSTHASSMAASTYIDEQAAGGGYGAYYDMRNEVGITTSLDDDGRVVDTNSNGTASMQLTQEMSYGISDVGEQHNEVTAALVADASYSDGAATSHAAVRATASTTGDSGLSYAELIGDALGIGENEGAIDYFTMDVVRSAFPVTLYDNASASASAAATLSETAANFSRLTIFFKDNDGNHSSADVWAPDGKRVALAITWISGASTQEMYQRVRWVTISGTSISTYKGTSDAKYRTGQVKLGATASVTNADYISIIHVIGWR